MFCMVGINISKNFNNSTILTAPSVIVKIHFNNQHFIFFFNMLYIYYLVIKVSVI